MSKPCGHEQSFNREQLTQVTWVSCYTNMSWIPDKDIREQLCKLSRYLIVKTKRISRKSIK